MKFRKPEPFGAFHMDALSRASSLPALSPANPTGAIWAPFPFPGSLAGKSLPTE